MSILAWLLRPLRRVLISAELQKIRQIEHDATSIYTTVQSFKARPNEYWSWAANVIAAPQYKYMLFDLRENVIRDIVVAGGQNCERQVGMLAMLSAFDAYLNRGTTEYEHNNAGRN